MAVASSISWRAQSSWSSQQCLVTTPAAAQPSRCRHLPHSSCSSHSKRPLRAVAAADTLIAQKPKLSYVGVNAALQSELGAAVVAMAPCQQDPKCIARYSFSRPAFLTTLWHSPDLAIAFVPQRKAFVQTRRCLGCSSLVTRCLHPQLYQRQTRSFWRWVWNLWSQGTASK